MHWAVAAAEDTDFEDEDELLFLADETVVLAEETLDLAALLDDEIAGCDAFDALDCLLDAAELTELLS